MSVFLVDLVIASGRTADDIVAAAPPHLAPFGLVQLTVGQVEDLELVVEEDPLDDEPAHAVVSLVASVAVVFAGKADEPVLAERVMETARQIAVELP